MTAIATIKPQQLSQEIESLQKQINELESELSIRQRDVSNLREAITTLEAGKPRPLRPEVDDVFELLKQLVGAVPQQLEDRQLYTAKLEAANNSLALAIETCGHKTSTLQLLNSELREKLAEQLFQKWVGQAEQFNKNANENFELLEKMKELRSQITRLRGGTAPLTIYGEEREAQACDIQPTCVIIKRRVDISRG